MQIEISRKLYQSLVKLAYLGEWMANGFRENDVKEITEIEQFIYSFNKNFGLESWLEYDEEAKLYFPSEVMEKKLHNYIDEYNDDIFWETLATRLAHRDIVHDLREDELRAMDFAEIVEKTEPYLEKYYDEFHKNGTDNLFIESDHDDHHMHDNKLKLIQ